MPRFFKSDITGEQIIIDGKDAEHIGRSLRMKIGDEITICDCIGNDYFCKISSISDEICCSIMKKEKSKSEPNVHVTLYQAMPKSDKFETIIQKSVELGVTKIVPILTTRCVSRPDKKTMSKKLKRYEKISLEAAKQCGRGIIPEISDIMSFKEAITSMKTENHAILFYERGGINLKNFNFSAKDNISIMIGSEGGFSEEEAEFAKNNGVIIAGLGNRILRCETAPLAALSIIMNLTDNM